MSALLGRRRVVAAIIVVLVAVVATESVVLAATVRQGTVEYMKVATEFQPASTSSLLWTDVPGTALAMSIPSGEQDFFQITFSADDPSCLRVDMSSSYGLCYVHALVDGLEVAPGKARFGASATPALGLPATMQWASNLLGPGTHYVKIQFEVNNPGNQLYLYGRTMTVVRARAS